MRRYHVDRAHLLQLRLSNQRLSTGLRTPREVVSWLGGVQAQDYPAAKWAVGQRTIDGTDAAIERAFDAGEILRTHVLRPTWHFVAPDDIRWMLELTAARLKAQMRSAYAKLGLDEGVLRRTNSVLAKALAGGGALTRADLLAALDRARVPARLRLIHILAWAEFDGVICSGPRRGRQFTYMLLDARAPRAKTMGRDEALAELSSRYFTSRGPATVRDFMWWSGLTAADAKRGLDSIASALELEQVTVDGATYWWRPSAAADTPAAKRRAGAEHTSHLLPVYDEFFVAYRDRSAAISERAGRTDTTFHQNPIFYPTVIVDGRLVSAWTRTAARSAIVMNIGPPAVPGTLRPAIGAAAGKYARFLGCPVSIVWKGTAARRQPVRSTV